MHSLAIIFLGQYIFFNFETQSFSYDIYKHTRTAEHFTDRETAIKVGNQLRELEQSKTYGLAKNIYLFDENDKIILTLW